MAKASKTDIFDYEALLERAQKGLPEGISEHSRFTVPDPDVLYEGKNTVFRNFSEIVDSLNRESSHLFGYLLKEFGTAGSIDGRRAIFKSLIPAKQLKSRIQSYVNVWVLCSECQRPDTHLIKDGRTLVLECEACGAHRPVKIRKGIRQQERAEPLLEGKVYEFMIQDVGKKGDGLAKRDQYIIFIPGTTKGARVKARIDRIAGTKAFATLVRE